MAIDLASLVIRDESSPADVRGEIVERLIRLSRHADPFVQRSAVNSLAGTKWDLPEEERHVVVDRLVQLMRDPDGHAASAAAKALVDLRGMAPRRRLAVVRRAVADRGP